MLASTTTLLTAFAALAAAAPTSNVVARAGGPAIKPIPSTCSITNPEGSATNFLPGPGAEAVQLYGAYYPSFSTNKTLMSEQCLQQCYGYGDSTQCKAAFWAENVFVPAGNPGAGQLETACLMYTRFLTTADFKPAPAGQATDAYTRNLAC